MEVGPGCHGPTGLSNAFLSGGAGEAGFTTGAYSIIGPDAEKFRVVVTEEDQHCFEGPNGQPLPKPKTERNLCVDEKAKAS